ncbi:transient receptor potential cation channel subfamily V member 3-like [Phascolarctos cinereus]
MYELVLELSEARRLRDSPASKTHLEKLRNQQGLTPLQLAAKEGQHELFQCILNRERPVGDPLHHLSRRFLEWTYGPVSCSLYDLSEVDTTEAQSALKMAVFNPDLEKAYKLLEVEPLHSLLESKWTSFAAPMFAISTAWYLVYMGLFTAITAHRPGTEGEPGDPPHLRAPDPSCPTPCLLAQGSLPLPSHGGSPQLSRLGKGPFAWASEGWRENPELLGQEHPEPGIRDGPGPAQPGVA